MEDGSEAIEDEELLFRRIPVASNWYSPETGEINAQAFAPHKKNDKTGLSLAREKYKSAEEAARSQSGKPAYVAVLRAGTLRAVGIEITPRPNLPDDPGHTELPDINSE